MFGSSKSIAAAGLFALLTGPAVAQVTTEAVDAEARQGVSGIGRGLGSLVELIGQINARLDALETAVAGLQGRVTALEGASGVLSDLAAFVVVDEVQTDLNGDGVIDPVSELLPRVLFQGVNLQLVNSDGSTNMRNGLGNLIVGYNEPVPDTVPFVCSDGAFQDNDAVTGCEANGHVWAKNHKSGSHNLVVGPLHAYSQTAGVVFGRANVINRNGATVTGGRLNTASGVNASVGGGTQNTASGISASVGGGAQNAAVGTNSSVSGGAFNTASGQWSSVSGGFLRTAPDNEDWAAGSLFEDF